MLFVVGLSTQWEAAEGCRQSKSFADPGRKVVYKGL
jgi:hypothetical protein